MKNIELKTMKREVASKGYLNGLKRDGWVPGIVYGHKSNIPVAVDGKSLKAVMKKYGMAALFHLEFTDKIDPVDVLVKDVQINPMSSNIIHVDFYKFAIGEKVTMTIPFNFIGIALGAKLGGTLEHLLRSVEIECLPKDIPEHIDVDISNLDIGQTIHLNELTLAEGIEIKADPESIIVAVAAPNKEIVEETESEVIEEDAEENEQDKEKETSAGA